LPGGDPGRIIGPMQTTVPTRFWHLLDDGRVQCDLCPRACRLREGQRGLCFVRSRQADGVVLTAYGRSSGFGVDPIEKKPLFHYRPGSAVLSFGTAGCNLACRFCQNWDISQARAEEVLAETAAPEKIAASAARLGSRVSLSPTTTRSCSTSTRWIPPAPAAPGASARWRSPPAT
jgi:pyruvate formate lyase activating enzyme